MGFGKKALRVGAAIGTGGLSEVAIRSGLLNGGGDAPERKNIELDAGTQELMAAQTAQAQETPEQIADRLTKGLPEQASGFNQASEFSNKFGSQVDPYSQALSNRFSRKMGDEQALMKSRARAAAPEQILQAQDRARRGAQAKAGMALQQQAAKYEAIAAKKNARAQMMGTIMGIAGTVGGAAIGGPAGAAAGGSIGKSMAPTSGPSIPSTGGKNLNATRVA